MMLRSWAPVFHEVEISAGQTSLIYFSHTAGVSSGGLFAAGIQKENLVRQIRVREIEKSSG
jgi:hypothetical protein